MGKCNNCGLQYSSYCIGCTNVKCGLNLTDREYTEYLRLHVCKEKERPTESIKNNIKRRVKK